MKVHVYNWGNVLKAEEMLKDYSFEPIDSNLFTVSIEMTFEEMIGLETKILHHRREQDGYTLAVDTERFQTR